MLTISAAHFGALVIKTSKDKGGEFDSDIFLAYAPVLRGRQLESIHVKWMDSKSFSARMIEHNINPFNGGPFFALRKIGSSLLAK